MKKFISTERKGFKMTFDNGLTVSVQWGKCNYCDNKNFNILEELKYDDFNCSEDMESNTAELAIMIDNIIIDPSLILDIGKYTSYTIGYLSPEEVLNYMIEVRMHDISHVDDIKTNINLLKTKNPDLYMYPPIV